MVSVSTFGQPYYIYQEFAGVEHPDCIELEDKAISFSSSDKVLYLAISTDLLAAGDTIKVVGQQTTIDGETFTGMNLITGQKSVNLGTGIGFIDNLTITCIGKGRICITKP